MPGTKYLYISGIWEGRGDSFKVCASCAEIAHAFAREQHGYPNLGALDEALRECVEAETTIDDEDNEILSDSGKRWSVALDGLLARGTEARAT